MNPTKLQDTASVLELAKQQEPVVDTGVTGVLETKEGNVILEQGNVLSGELTIMSESTEIVADNGENLLGVATIDANDLVEDGKSLSDYAYEEAKKELEAQAQRDMLNSIKEEDLPQIEVKALEKEKAIEEIADAIEQTIEENADRTPEKVIEAMATKFYEEQERQSTRVMLLESKNNDLESIVKDLQSENLKLKHGGNKVDVDDDIIGSTIVSYREWRGANSPADIEKNAKKMASMSIGLLRLIYPEIESSDVFKIITDKRSKGIKAIEGMTASGQRDIDIKEIKTPTARKPSPRVPA